MAILPGQVWGPPMGARRDSESIRGMLGLLAGRFWPAVPPLEMGCVDVRDMAAAHTLAIAVPKARGR